MGADVERYASGDCPNRAASSIAFGLNDPRIAAAWSALGGALKTEGTDGPSSASAAASSAKRRRLLKGRGQRGLAHTAAETPGAIRAVPPGLGWAVRRLRRFVSPDAERG
jgi:hypothetical protein